MDTPSHRSSAKMSAISSPPVVGRSLSRAMSASQETRRGSLGNISKSYIETESGDEHGHHGFRISVIKPKPDNIHNPSVSYQNTDVRPPGGGVSIKTCVVRRTSTDSNLKLSDEPEVKVSWSAGRPSVSLYLAKAVPVLRKEIRCLESPDFGEQGTAMAKILQLMMEAWAIPTIGRDVAYGLCNVLREEGGLDILIHNCKSPNYQIKLSAARLLEQTMTVENRDAVAVKGLEAIVNMAKTSRNDWDLIKATCGILESLFKHSPETCSKVVRIGGLDSILYSCRTIDVMTLRNCAEALANLALYGGRENQQLMVTHKATEWLFPLAFSDDDQTRYYALIAIAVLSANKDLESVVAKSSALELVKPFVLTHIPSEFARSDLAHLHGQSKEWLQQLLPLLESNREEAQCLAAFHFAMETVIKVEQGQSEWFGDIQALEPLQRVACGTNRLASRMARTALENLGEQVAYSLSLRVPLWTPTDVKHWLQQSGFGNYAEHFVKCDVDGDILLTLSDENLKTDLQMTNGIYRKRFYRELKRLKMSADYSSCDSCDFEACLLTLGPEFLSYTYSLIRAGVSKRNIQSLSDQQLKEDCMIGNGIHRMQLLELFKEMGIKTGKSCSKKIDVFISYRRSNGSQLASLLKVHLQLRGFTVFLDIEKLRAGKFDEDLLNSVKNARNFLLVLTPNCLDRCLDDKCLKDWVHREVVAAIEGHCNIIPVMDNFQWPASDNLPEDMRPVCSFNGIRWIHDYQEACVDKLETFLRGDSTNLNSQQLLPYPVNIFSNLNDNE